MIKNIIFDLGGVIYELDFQRFNHNFSLLQKKSPPHQIYSRLKQPPVFSDYERGTIDTATFCRRVREELGLVATDETIVEAWNSLLVGLFPGRKELLEKLASQFRLALLSNINPLHLDHIKSECREIFQLFEHCFFSCQLGTRKPELTIFNLVLHQMEFHPQETLFLDDSPPNIEAAMSLGIKSILVQEPEKLSEIINQETN